MKIQTVLVLTAAMAVPSLVEGAKGALDGMTFVGDVGLKGKPAGGKDEIVFSWGRFRSKACDPWGFSDGAYSATAKDGSVSFSAETTNGNGGKIAWKGTVKGPNFDGTFVWTQRGKEPAEYWVKATLKTEAARALDGLTFVGEAGPKGKPAGGKDEVFFHEGSFRSKACDPHGFGDGAYTANARDGEVSFVAETTDGKGGKIAWKGTIKGPSLEGTYVWTLPGKQPIDYWIKATLKQ